MSDVTSWPTERITDERAARITQRIRWIARHVHALRANSTPTPISAISAGQVRR